MFFFQSVKISFNVETVSVRWQNNGSFGFAKGRLVCWAKPNVPFCAVGFFVLCQPIFFALSLSS
jgi:hypothetical protein